MVVSSKGRTWTNKHRQTAHQKHNSRRYQRNRHMDDYIAKQMPDGGMTYEELQHHVEKCRSKFGHKSRGAAYQAKLQYEKDYGKPLEIYECPICGRWHLTSHPWVRE